MKSYKNIFTKMLCAIILPLALNACGLFRASGQAVEEVGDGAGTVIRGVGSGVSGAVQGVGRAVNNGVDETVDAVD